PLVPKTVGADVIVMVMIKPVELRLQVELPPSTIVPQLSPAPPWKSSAPTLSHTVNCDAGLVVGGAIGSSKWMLSTSLVLIVPLLSVSWKNTAVENGGPPFGP